MATIPHGDVHIATSETDSFTQIVFLTGDTPPVVTLPEVAAAALAQWSVVGRDGAGKIVLATWAADDTGIEPIGVTVNAIDPAVGALATVAVYRAGCFNPKALVWGPRFDTDAKKKTAFEKTGTQIFLRAPIY